VVAILQHPLSTDGTTVDTTLFSQIGDDIERQGYSVRPAALPEDVTRALSVCQAGLAEQSYRRAGIGRGDDYLKNGFVRTDEICWITGATAEGAQWIDWAGGLQTYLNRRFFLGLFSFESHFSHYAPGDYYKRHYDAFRGEANRVLSLVVYLNPGWQAADGGELVLYRDDADREGTRVVPLLGTIVTFLSEEFPHEVLPARRDRHAVAGWFRVNTSSEGRADPPQ
jgi:SM-20-related protein